MSRDEAAEVSTLTPPSTLPFTLGGYADRVSVDYPLNHDPQTDSFQTDSSWLAHVATSPRTLHDILRLNRLRR